MARWYKHRPEPALSDGTSPEPSDFTFDGDPGRARRVRAMRRIYESELERARYYRDRHGVPFDESELAGYRYITTYDDTDDDE